jgi:hypothetical protein
MQVAAQIQALEFSNAISMGEVGIDTNFYTTAIYAHFINFTMQDESGFGIQVTPVRALLDLPTIGFTAVTFVNAIIYYDFFKWKDAIQLGPFASINTVNALKIDSVECHAGLLFTLRTLRYDSWAFSENIPTSFEWLTVRAGYEYLDGDGNFYMQIGIDLLTTMGVIALVNSGSNSNSSVDFPWMR